MKLFNKTILLITLLICSLSANGQCVTVDSSFYTFTSSTITIKPFPGFSWLPRTNASSITTPLYAEGRSSNPKFAASSTTIYSGASAKTNVFFGGDDNSNGHANTQIITKKTYSLLDGPITIKGTFLNRNTDPKYNESYIGIVPSSYSYFAPLDCDLSSLVARQGIIIGAVTSSGNAYLFDHGDIYTAIKTVKGPISHGISMGKWFTMEVTYQIINSHLYMTKAIYNDGSGAKQPLGTMIDIGLVSNFSWLNSVNIVWGVDDLLADVSIVKKECKIKKCITEDSLVYDLDVSNLTRTPTPSSSNIIGTDFSKITTPLAVESVATNDKAFSNSNLVYNPSSNRPTVYFGGDAPSPAAQHSASITTSKTFNLFTGPITIEGQFFNRFDQPLYNEAYICIVPKNYTWYTGWITGNNLTFEGIRIGARPYAALVVDAKDATTSDNVIYPLTTHNFAKNGEWYKMKATFDTLNSNLVLSLFQINNGSGYKDIITNPLIIGKASNYPWLSELRAQLLVDDLVDTIKITKLNCLSICKISKENGVLNICKNLTKNIDAKTYFKLNNNSISTADGSFKLVAFNGDRKHVNITNYALSNSSELNTNWPAGKWRIQFTSKCGAIDSIEINLLPKPKLVLKPITSFCSVNTPINLTQYLDTVFPSNATIKWFGNNVSNNQLNLVIPKDSQWLKNQSINCMIADTFGCADTIKNINYSIRNFPTININPKPKTIICKGNKAFLTATTTNLNSVTWSLQNLSDGVISNPKSNNINYTPGPNDLNRNLAYLKVYGEWTASDPCPQVVDSVTVEIAAKPKLNLKSLPIFCNLKQTIDLNLLVDSVSPKNAKINWFGNNITNGFLVINSGVDSTFITNNFINATITDLLGCTDTVNKIQYVIKNSPIINIISQKPLSSCENMPFKIISNSKYSNGIQWQKIQNADGNIDNSNNTNIEYLPGSLDKIRSKAYLKVSSIPFTNDPCPQISDSIELQIVAQPKIQFSKTISACAPHLDSFVVIETTGKSPANLTYDWKLNNMVISQKQKWNYNFLNQGIYNISIKVSENMPNCADSINQLGLVQIFPKPKSSFLSNPEEWAYSENPQFKFQSNSSIDETFFKNNKLSHYWKFSNARFDTNSNDFSPSFSGIKGDSGTYWSRLIVVSDKGCADTTSKKLMVISKLKIYAPTAFSPDDFGPNANNRYYLYASNYKTAWIKIYNRWGEKLYESIDLKEGWDGQYMGKPCMDGVYVVVADIRDFNGYHNLYKGTITLLR